MRDRESLSGDGNRSGSCCARICLYGITDTSACDAGRNPVIIAGRCPGASGSGSNYERSISSARRKILRDRTQRVGAGSLWCVLGDHESLSGDRHRTTAIRSRIGCDSEVGDSAATACINRNPTNITGHCPGATSGCHNIHTAIATGGREALRGRRNCITTRRSNVEGQRA